MMVHSQDKLGGGGGGGSGGGGGGEGGGGERACVMKMEHLLQ